MLQKSKQCKEDTYVCPLTYDITLITLHYITLHAAGVERICKGSDQPTIEID